MTLSDVRSAIEAEGLAYRGGLRLEQADLRAGVDAGSLVLVGFAGKRGWDAFESSLERQDGDPHPLDRWSRRVIGAIALKLDATPLFPFEGPPWWPFQNWASRAEPLFPSPLGMLIHPEWGLWHSWRGALVFKRSFEFPALPSNTHPCDTCVQKPCLTACPVHAFDRGRYDVSCCTGYLALSKDADCVGSGCAARRACPVGRDHQYKDEQASFHMEAFLVGTR